jgi:LPXTG-motif cell wall-anchored protein
LGGVNTYVKGSGLALVHITEKELVTHSDTVYVTHEGDTTVDSADRITKDTQYSPASGSTKITLDAAYLETLAVGEHLLTVGFNDDEEPVQDVFYITEKEVDDEIIEEVDEEVPPTNLPKTGDSGTLVLLAVLATFALSGAGILFGRKRWEI